MQEWREETTAIVNELLADGSNPDLEYEIEHHFACQDFDLLEGGGRPVQGRFRSDRCRRDGAG